MNCLNCNKQFSSKYTLKRHEKLNSCKTTCPSCNTLVQSIQNHLINCPVELNYKIKELEIENRTIKPRCTQLELDNERYIGQITKFQNIQKQIDALNKEVKELKKNKSQGVINNIEIGNLQISNTDDFSKLFGKKTNVKTSEAL